MTKSEYENQWNQVFAPLTNEAMPGYDEYRINERMLEDYLDIFRGYNSRVGNIKMPYDHPFFGTNGNPLLIKKPQIKYILIGEARPPFNLPLLNACGGDKANTYFYDIRHIKPTAYLSAPRNNWTCPIERPCPHNKVQTLLCLASNGVLLLDIFPFAIKFGPIRSRLNTSGVTRDYWDNVANPYSLSNRITAIKGLLWHDWDLTLVAPCIISEYIINPVNFFPPIPTIPAGLHPAQFRTFMADVTRCPLGANWRKVAVSSAGTPTQNLISISF